MARSEWHQPRALATVGLAITLLGCGPAASPPTPSSSATAVPFSSCRDLDLRMPDGEPLDLSGTWLGNDDSYWTFSQVGDCVWATATDRYVVAGESDYWQLYLRGTLLPDFTMPVEYAYSSFSDSIPPHYGHGVLSIEFGGGDPSETVTLRKTAGCTGGEDDLCPPGTGTLQTTAWSLLSPTVILPPPTPEP